MRAFLLTLLAIPLALAAPAAAEPGIILFRAIGRPDAVRVSGRVVKELPKDGSSALSRNLRRLAAPNWVGADVEVRLLDRVAKTVSTDDGAFEVTFGATGAAPFAPGRHAITAKVPGAEATSAIEIAPAAAPFLVISDFDDTVAITNVTSRRGLVKAALLQDSDTQPPVEGMSAFYGCLVESAPARPPLAFVSGSPLQFVPRISSFLDRHAFPFAGLYLRDLGADTLHGYKQPILRRLLDQFSSPVVLVGDSGEHDPEIYAQIRREYPGRIARVYIRDAGRAADPARFDGMLLFREAREAALDAVAKGFADAGCVARAFPAPASAAAAPAEVDAKPASAPAPAKAKAATP